MRTLGVELSRVALILILIAPMAAGQDKTGEWKASLTDLERRLPALPSEGAAVDSWRADAEALRSSIASTGASYAGDNIQLPEALPTQPSRSQLEQQVRALSAAVDQAIRQSPGFAISI
jgi:hypothetical protein